MPPPTLPQSAPPTTFLSTSTFGGILSGTSGPDQLTAKADRVALDGPAVLVARLAAEKDIATLLRAVALMKQNHPDFRLVIAGDGRCDGRSNARLLTKAYASTSRSSDTVMTWRRSSAASS